MMFKAELDALLAAKMGIAVALVGVPVPDANAREIVALLRSIDDICQNIRAQCRRECPGDSSEPDKWAGALNLKRLSQPRAGG
jgi:hypothetical protein